MSKKKKSSAPPADELVDNPSLTDGDESGIDQEAVKVDNENEAVSEAAAHVAPAEQPKLNPGSGGEYQLVDGKLIKV